jgi:CRP/FNR family transcriptional regulator, cyclic AMP receptor protein
MPKETLLRKVSLFSDLPDVDLKRLASVSQNRRYRKHEVVFHTYDTGTVLFILKSGAVKVSIRDRKGREIILKLLFPADFFGEMALLDGQHRSAEVIAVEPVEALVVQREDFLEILRNHPELPLRMMLALCRRLRQTDEKIKGLVFADAYGKVAQALLRLMKDQGHPNPEGGFIDIPLTREELASLAGTSRQTLSRVMRDYQRAGVLKVFKRQILILDEARLQREALC